MTIDVTRLRQQVAAFEPEPYPVGRILSLYSMAIAVAEKSLLNETIALGQQYDIERPFFYEIVLQSYLFLGFPRMLEAADHLNSLLPSKDTCSQLVPVSSEESQQWFDRGLNLCQAIYDSNYDRLKNRVESFAPEVFRWMVFEGYGKVLARPGVSVIDRELAIVACLIIENRPRQLHSHIRGALNIGADIELVYKVIEDIGPAGGEGFNSALEIMAAVGRN